MTYFTENNEIKSYSYYDDWVYNALPYITILIFLSKTDVCSMWPSYEGQDIILDATRAYERNERRGEGEFSWKR